jgi:hypothetical protein
VVVALVETSSSDSTTFCPAEPMKSGISNSRSVITESDRVHRAASRGHSLRTPRDNYQPLDQEKL